MEYGSHYVPPAGNLIGSRYHDVLAGGEVSQGPPYLNCSATLIQHIPHNDKQVHVAPVVRCSSRLRTEQDDARRLETSDDTFNHG